MHVRMINSMQGPAVNLKPGDTTDQLPDPVARRLIACGDAVEVKRGMRRAQIETAVREAGEQAVQRLIARDREWGRRA